MLIRYTFAIHLFSALFPLQLVLDRILELSHHRIACSASKARTAAPRSHLKTQVGLTQLDTRMIASLLAKFAVLQTVLFLLGCLDVADGKISPNPEMLNISSTLGEQTLKAGIVAGKQLALIADPGDFTQTLILVDIGTYQIASQFSIQNSTTDTFYNWADNG